MPLDAEAETWFVKIGDEVFGPYQRERLRAFAAEGRVRAFSMVATEREGEFVEARTLAVLSDILTEENEAQTGAPPAAPPPRQGQLATFLVIADVETEVERLVERILGSIGPTEHVMRGVWMCRAATSVESIRNAVTKVLSGDDVFFAIDASRDRAAWFNLGQESDAALRALREDA